MFGHLFFMRLSNLEGLGHLGEDARFLFYGINLE
jgi:hypothetical protein